MTRSPARILRRVTLLVALLAAAGWSVIACSTPEVGLVNGQLKPCPDSPNCVCSQTPPDDPGHFIEPLPLPAGAADPIARLGELLSELPRVDIVETRDDYLHAVFISRILRFRDDVEFLLDRQAGVFQVRSASRLGYSDLGANRERVERLRELLSQ